MTGGAGRKGRLRRKDAEGKVNALVRAGVVDTASCCFHPVRHVHRETQCELAAFVCERACGVLVICTTDASVLPVCMNIWR